MRVLVVNAGSSSLKLRVVDDGDAVLASADLGPPGDSVDDDLDRFLSVSPPVDAAGHRVVHGGAGHERPLLVDAGADEELARLAELAPLHNPPALLAIRALRRRHPGLAQVACFDTAFHAAMPARASTYALPARWRDGLGIRRFGFHGLSHAWASRRAAEVLGRPLETTRLVTAHIGSGASLAAVDGGRSIDTTMGFTPIEGLVMATRSGSVDAGAVLYAVRHGLGAEEAEDDLERRSGLLGLSERSGDLREVVAGADEGDVACALAYEVYVYRLQKAVGEMAVALGGMDALVFTGGAGENSARLRSDVCSGLGVVGVPRLGLHGSSGEAAPSGATGATGRDRLLSAPGSSPAVIVVEAREDLEIAHGVRRALSGEP